MSDFELTSPTFLKRRAGAKVGHIVTAETRARLSATHLAKPHAEPYRWELLAQGLPALCKVHGLHHNWRQYKTRGRPNASCRLCTSAQEAKTRKSDALNAAFIYARGRRRKGLGFNITRKFITDLYAAQAARCALTGVAFDQTHPPSIDRIDSTRGYLTDNVQLVLADINRMKLYFPQEDFIRMCGQVVNMKTPEYGMQSC